MRMRTIRSTNTRTSPFAFPTSTCTTIKHDHVRYLSRTQTGALDEVQVGTLQLKQSARQAAPHARPSVCSQTRTQTLVLKTRQL